MRKKHVPQRLCVVCRQPADKRSLLRFVRQPEGQVELDPTGKMPGRGAYLCLRPECQGDRRKWQKVAKSLKTNINNATACRLEEQVQQVLSLRGGGD